MPSPSRPESWLQALAELDALRAEVEQLRARVADLTRQRDDTRWKTDR